MLLIGKKLAGSNPIIEALFLPTAMRVSRDPDGFHRTLDYNKLRA
jgi:hypothetical protein